MDKHFHNSPNLTTLHRQNSSQYADDTTALLADVQSVSNLFIVNYLLLTAGLQFVPHKVL